MKFRDILEGKNTKSKCSDELHAYARTTDGRETREIISIAGKLDNFAATGNPGVIKDAVNMLKYMDKGPRDKVMEIIKKNDPAMGKSLAFKLTGLKEEVELEEGYVKNLAFRKVEESILHLLNNLKPTSMLCKNISANADDVTSEFKQMEKHIKTIHAIWFDEVGYTIGMNESLDEAQKEVTPQDVEDYLVKTGVNPKDAKDAVKKGFGYASKKYGGPTFKSALKKIADVVWTLAEETELEESKGFEVQYMKGFSQKVLVKKFKTEDQYEKWYDKNEGNIEVLAFRDLDESDELDEAATHTPEKILGSKPSQSIKSKDQWIKAAKGMGLVVKSPSTTPDGDNNSDMYLTAFDKQGNMKGTWYKTHGVFKD